MRLAPLLSICCALIGPATAAAASPAALRASVVGSGTWMIGSDGVRFAAWQGDDVASTFVYDDVTRRTSRVTPPAAGCTITAIGAGALAASCDAYPLLGSGWLLNLRTGVWRQVVAPGLEPGDFESRGFVGVGSRWLQADLHGYHNDVSQFRARADGRAYTGARPFGPRVQPSLDAAGLRRRICSPLRARPQPSGSDSYDGWLPLQIEGRFALDVLEGPVRVVLRRCGSTRRQTVCRTWCFTPTLMHGRAVWADDRGVLHARAVRARTSSAYIVRNHPISAVYRLGSRVLMATDEVAGTRGFVVRVAAARGLRRP
jgi:hypothetical protein